MAVFLENHRSNNDIFGKQIYGNYPHKREDFLRELKQKIFTAVLHTESDTITDADLELSYESVSSSTISFALRTAEEEKERIIRALKQANGNKILAARLLAISRSTLYAKIEEYGIKVEKTFK